MWHNAKTGQANADFQQLLTECEDYAPHVSRVMVNLQRDDVAMWYWSGRGFRLALAYRITPGDCLILVGVPSPEGTPRQWCSTMIRKLRKELDALGITDWRAYQQDSYESEHMAEFADGIDRFCHEVEGDQTRHNRRELNFKRRAEKMGLDELYEGPGKNRPPRKKKPKKGGR